MFTLVSGAYRYLTRQEEYNVLMLGLDNAGKTTLLEKIKHVTLGVPGMAPEKIQPTVGVNMAKVQVQRRILRFMDIGGAKELRGIWEAYYDEGHAIMFVVDSNDAKRMEEARAVLLGLARAPELEGLPLLVLANKQDLSGVGSLAQVKEMVNSVADFLDTREVRVFGSSALDGSGTEDAIQWLFGRIVENSKNRPPLVPEL
ncbi:ADP-ribosylation factor protein 3 [Coemansia sp. RSA 552]|nr:ADP-ribosylation factor protein 3 [Coemansia sp. RSA 552]